MSSIDDNLLSLSQTNKALKSSAKIGVKILKTKKTKIIPSGKNLTIFLTILSLRASPKRSLYYFRSSGIPWPEGPKFIKKEIQRHGYKQTKERSYVF
jgi:hypothetical protein